MKRLFIPLFLLGGTFPLCAQAAKNVGRALYLAKEHPEETFSLVGFLIDVFLMCIPIAIVSGIVCLILKSVFDLKKEDTANAFFVVAGILLGISLLVYFLA